MIRPGVDEAWRAFPLSDASEIRTRLGYAPTDIVILYFGSPVPLRGLHTLIKAFELARRDIRSLKLLVLSRRRRDELLCEDAELDCLLSYNELSQHVKVISGYLDRETLVKHVAASDVVALPFELVPSDAPLSLLETQALGKPIVTTDVACLAELVSGGDSYLAQPADPYSLAQALQKASEDRGARSAGSGMISERSAIQSGIRSWQQMGKEWSQLIQNL